MKVEVKSHKIPTFEPIKITIDVTLDSLEEISKLKRAVDQDDPDAFYDEIMVIINAISEVIP